MEYEKGLPDGLGGRKNQAWEASETLACRLKSGRDVTGTMLSELSSPNIVRILGIAGFEFIIVDCEHGAFDYSQLAALISVGTGFGIPVLVRVPGTGREFITKVLDMGAAGILVPMVNNAEDAKKVVSFAKYAPCGKRGISTQRAHTNYNPPPLGVYMEEANQRILAMVQIETAEALENIESIAAVPGIDVLMIGPNDLAADLGVPGNVEAPEISDAAAKVCATAGRQGKPSGIITSNQALIQRCRGMGMTVFSCGSEIGMLLAGARRTYAAARRQDQES